MEENEIKVPIKTYNLTTGETDIILVQPNKVTNARHDYDEREENILTLMIEAIQKHMSREEVLQRDLFNQPIIKIEVDSKQEKMKYLHSLSKMQKKSISFEWFSEKYNSQVETNTTLVSTYHNLKGELRIEVVLNIWAIPYLLYWGKGVGGTIFNKRIALTLNGKYTKRMYKLCKRWEDKGGFSMKLDDLLTMLSIPRSYNISKVKERVLDDSIKEMKRAADIYFKYSMQKENDSRSYNYITFKIFQNPKNIHPDCKIIDRKKLENKGELYQYVYRILSIAYPPIKSSAAFEKIESLSITELEKAYERFKRLENEARILDRSITDYIPLIKHIMNEDFKM